MTDPTQTQSERENELVRVTPSENGYTWLVEERHPSGDFYLSRGSFSTEAAAAAERLVALFDRTPAVERADWLDTRTGDELEALDRRLWSRYSSAATRRAKVSSQYGREVEEVRAARRRHDRHGEAADQAVAYFAETLKRRLDAGVVDAEAYLAETRRALERDGVALDELLLDGTLQADQYQEKSRRLEAKRKILRAAELERDLDLARERPELEARAAVVPTGVDEDLALERIAFVELNASADELWKAGRYGDAGRASQEANEAAGRIQELERIQESLRLAAERPQIRNEAADRCVNCGGYPEATASSMDDPVVAGCSCIGDYAPGWKRDDVDELQARQARLDGEIERLRGEQSRRDGEPIDDFRRRIYRWRATWAARFDERRWIARRLAELQPLDPHAARIKAYQALEARATSLESMALEYHAGGEAGVELLQEAAALRQIAAILADDGTSRYEMVPRDGRAYLPALDPQRPLVNVKRLAEGATAIADALPGEVRAARRKGFGWGEIARALESRWPSGAPASIGERFPGGRSKTTVQRTYGALG